MGQEDLDQHLNLIDTAWSVVRRAHAGSADAARDAQRQILDRYGGAVRRYLAALVRDPDAADELFQEFACRLLDGDLKGADPERGRFRNFVKGVLFHLVARYHERRRRQPGALPPDHPEPAAEVPSECDSDRAFLESWRAELLSRTWDALAEHERRSGQPFHTVLHCRASHPDWQSTRLAEEMAVRLGKPVSAVAVRQTLHRSREKFAELLLDEVAHSLDGPTPDRLEEELADLRLIDYCRAVLARRRRQDAAAGDGSP